MKPNETLVWIIYDISENKVRNKVARACKHAGLYRIQLSAFVGVVNRNTLDELALQIEEMIEETDRAYIFPMCEADFKKCRLLGETFDLDLVSDNLRELIV